MRPIGDLNLGLAERKLRQLAEADCFEEILVSSDDEIVLDFASSYPGSLVKPVRRESQLCSDDTLLESLIMHAGIICQEDHILWTHVTSPFTDSNAYRRVAELYPKALELGHDSLVSAVAERKFASFRGRPLNYGGADFWPKTQELEPVLLMTSAIFMAPRTTYSTQRNRVGRNPFNYLQNGIEAFDVDEQEDWDLASVLISLGYPRQKTRVDKSE